MSNLAEEWESLAHCREELGSEFRDTVADLVDRSYEAGMSHSSIGQCMIHVDVDHTYDTSWEDF